MAVEHRTTLLTGIIGAVLAAASCTRADPQPPTSVQWNDASEISPTTLRVRWLGSACAEFDSAKVAETGREVSISILERSTGDEDHCTASGVLRSTDVRLKAPLARRLVLGCRTPPCLDGSTRP